MTAAALTARVGYRPAGRDVHGRICREAYHAVVDGPPVDINRSLTPDWSAIRSPGEALCGAEPLTDCPDGLFPPQVTCPACLAIAAREGVQIGGAS